MVTISKYSNNSFLKNIFQGLLISICGSIGSFLVLAPISLFIKIGVLLFILMVFVFFANPFLAINSFLFIRPSIQPLMDVEIVPGVPIVGIFSLWIITYLIFRFLNDKSYTVAIPNIKILFIMIILSLFSMFNSKSLTTSIAHLLRLMGWISIYILIFNLVSTWDDAKKIIFVLILSSVIPLLVGYYQLFTNTGAIDELRGGINRIYSVFKGNANTAGVFFLYEYFHNVDCSCSNEGFINKEVNTTSCIGNSYYYHIYIPQDLAIYFGSRYFSNVYFQQKNDKARRPYFFISDYYLPWRDCEKNCRNISSATICRKFFNIEI